MFLCCYILSCVVLNWNFSSSTFSWDSGFPPMLISCSWPSLPPCGSWSEQEIEVLALFGFLQDAQISVSRISSDVLHVLLSLCRLCRHRLSRIWIVRRRVAGLHVAFRRRLGRPPGFLSHSVILHSLCDPSALYNLIPVQWSWVSLCEARPDELCNSAVWRLTAGIYQHSKEIAAIGPVLKKMSSRHRSGISVYRFWS